MIVYTLYFGSFFRWGVTAERVTCNSLLFFPDITFEGLSRNGLFSIHEELKSEDCFFCRRYPLVYVYFSGPVYAGCDRESKAGIKRFRQRVVGC